MDFILPILMILMIAITAKNIAEIIKNKKTKEYAQIYQGYLRNIEGTEERLDAYLLKEKNPEILNKAKLIKTLYNIEADRDYKELFKDIDIGYCFNDGNRFNQKRFFYNIDAPILIMIMMALGKGKNNNEIIEDAYQKINVYRDVLSNFVEFKTIEAFYFALTNKEDQGVGFAQKLLSADYGEYNYEKRMIVLFKRFAATIMAYLNKPLEDLDVALMNDFTNSYMGLKVLTALNLYDKYVVKKEEE